MTRALTLEETDAYQRDGVVLIRGALGLEWQSHLRAVIDSILEEPGLWISDTGDQGRGAGRALDARYLWRENDAVRSFVLESGVAGLVGHAMGCDELRFYFDHWFVKEPGAKTSTPWHQDVSYWPVTGQQIASLWLPLTEVDRASSGLELVKGSHRWGKYYMPRRFVATDQKSNWIHDAEGETLPDIEAERDRYDIFSAPMQPGDALIFSAWIIHAAPSNTSDDTRAAVSTRWLGDDVRWRPHPAADPTVRKEDVSIAPGELARDDEIFPVAWTRRSGAFGARTGF